MKFAAFALTAVLSLSTAATAAPTGPPNYDDIAAAIQAGREYFEQMQSGVVQKRDDCGYPGNPL